MLNVYKIATSLASPLVPLWLQWRMLRGKEERGRIKERYGKSSYGRPKGTLLWIHASSVGEANSVLALITQLKKHFPNLNILLTTGTVTSAALMKKRLPEGVLHHYAPVDTPEATRRFMRHWLPNVVWFVESELWPNLIDTAKQYYCLMALINARMSERSFHSWQKYPRVASEMLSAFQFCFAQSEADASRLKALGAKEVITSGNLKYDAPPLPCKESELIAFQSQLAGRTSWLAASTHPGEEIMVAKAHRQLAGSHPGLLTVIVPRHPDRGAELARELSAYGKASLRSRKESITADTAFYVADTLGELGLFYRLCNVTFMGGSLVLHGGQNPLEAAQLSCAILAGPYVHNFKDMYAELFQSGAVLPVLRPEQLAQKLAQLLDNPSQRNDMQVLAKAFTQQRAGASQTIFDHFAPVLAQ